MEKTSQKVGYSAAALRKERQDVVVDRSSRLEQVGVNSSSAQFLLSSFASEDENIGQPFNSSGRTERL
jgi:hypothetical protein